MTPEVSDFIPGLLDNTDKYIEAADRHHITEGKKRASMNKKGATIMEILLSQHCTT